MALFINRGLTPCSACEDLYLFLKHKYSLPAGGFLYILNSTGAIGSGAFNVFKQVVLDVA